MILKQFEVKNKNFVSDLINYKRFPTRSIKLNHFDIGGSNFIRLQSMTNTTTTDVDATVEQITRIVESGADYVRVTTPTIKDVLALDEIRRKIRVNYETPLIADVHFSPKVAYAALDVADKIRINPGNFIDRKRGITYDEKKYKDELARIEEVFAPILGKALHNKRVIRIGTNIGSLSDRILQKYGATPEAMVQATLEYIEIARKYDFHDIVVSIKASNPRVNVWANRLLVSYFIERGYDYPIHLGVTEAGNGLEGRIKSAVGIGALLVDGIGDTIRVSLTEAPENEIPVARKIVNHVIESRGIGEWDSVDKLFFDPYDYNPRKVTGGLLPDYPVVIANVGKVYRNFVSPFVPDYVFVEDENLVEAYTKDNIGVISPGGKDGIRYVKLEGLDKVSSKERMFVELSLDDIARKGSVAKLKKMKNIALVFVPGSVNVVAELRTFMKKIIDSKIDLPVILRVGYKDADLETIAIKAAIDSGVFFIDGLVNGIWIDSDRMNDVTDLARIGFEILQASNARVSKAEIVACPSCGRSTFDVEQVTNQIKLRFGKMKGIKIAVMGCIVNGLGEMADADYGYVGTGNGLVSLYYKKQLIKRNIKEQEALDELENLIKSQSFNQKNA